MVNSEKLDSIRYQLLCISELLKVLSVADSVDHQSAIAGLGAIAHQIEGLTTDLEKVSKLLAE